ncbi:unnamed protein product, partial [Effrenium voratum]
VQRLFQVGTYRAMLERHNNGKKIGVEQLFRDFSKLTVAAGEKITMNYLTSAASIFNKFFASNVLKDTAFPSQEMAFLADELFGKRTPIDSVAKLEDLIKIARSDVESISWLFTSLCDYVLNGVCKVAEMNSSALSGGKSNPKGLYHVWLWKRENLSLLLAKIEMHVDQEDVAIIRRALASHTAYREHFGGWPFNRATLTQRLEGATKPAQNLSWLGALSAAGQLAAKFAADIAYTAKWDGVLKGSVRWGASLQEFLEHTDVAPLWSKVSGSEKNDAVPMAGNDSFLLSADEQLDSFVSFVASEAKVTVKEMKDDDALQVRDAVDESKTLVSSLLSTVDGSVSCQQLALALRALEVSKVRGSPKAGTVLFWYDNESSGEQSSDPRRSLTPLRRDQLEKTIMAAMSIREPEAPDWDADEAPALCPQACDVYIFTDGGRSTHGTNFTSMFTKTAGNVAQRRVNLIYSEEAVTEHRK